MKIYMTIKHIFIGGGNIYGFSFFGLLKQANIDGIWLLKDIKTIHGISAGAMIATIISLNLEWEVLEDYLINRPWDKLFHLNMYSIFNSIQNRGIFSKTEFYEIFKPLFLAKDISYEITMREFYEYTGIEHYYTVSKINSEINNLECLTISYKTHPDWKILDVIYMSSCLPILFSPIFIDNDIYLDGIFTFKKNIIDEIKYNTNSEIIEDETLFITLDNEIIKPLESSSSLFDYLIYFILFLIKPQIDDLDNNHINYYKIKKESINLESFYLTLTNKEERMRLINLGINSFYHN